jgi:hypothetical protein
MSSTTMGESASRIPPQNLPFSVQPATAQGLAGYSSAPQASAPMFAETFIFFFLNEQNIITIPEKFGKVLI